jgi:GT2 family glycosyltransferase
MRNLPPQKPIVSIVIATYNRLKRLQRCIAKVRENVSVPHETIVVGGGPADGTAKWMAAQPDIRFIQETRRQGAARAYDQGLRAAVGKYVMWLNDDSYPLPGAVEAAIYTLKRPDLDDVGMVAFYHNLEHEWNRLDSIEHQGEIYSIYNVRGIPYANFGLLRRELLEQVGFLDLRYYFAGWDPDLSLKIQREAGLKVIGCPDALVYHEQIYDERKAEDQAIQDQDNQKLFEKWQLPEKFSYPDPAPAYQAMVKELALV